jgi:hypothetical protein
MLCWIGDLRGDLHLQYSRVKRKNTTHPNTNSLSGQIQQGMLLQLAGQYQFKWACQNIPSQSVKECELDLVRCWFSLLAVLQGMQN